jgi:hypothetical protein
MRPHERSGSSPRAWPAWSDLALLALALSAFAALTLAPRIGLPFVGDDYVFLDKTLASSFAALWSPATSIDFGWYRPWAREVHFWSLLRTVGPDPLAFRLVNVALWVYGLGVYAAIVSRLASRRVAAVATLGVATLALWGTPLLWISGSQDLWMLAFLLTSYWLFMTGRALLALPLFVLALLSKETAGVLPALLVAHLLLVERVKLSSTLRRTLPFWGALLLWVILHPTLHIRILGRMASTAELENRPAFLVIVGKSLAACLNLHRSVRPQEMNAILVGAVIASALLVGTGVLVAARRHAALAPGSRPRAVAWLAGAWSVIGLVPVLLPSIGWHAYYVCLGGLGAWLGIALWLQARPWLAAALLVSLALLRGAHAYTLSSDWGDETYILRAGSALEAIRGELERQYPSLPPHSRVYFASIPSHIGLIAGESPALRVWYRDPTLQAGYYSYYRPRQAGAPGGRDYFFRFDFGRGMVEIKAGPEDVAAALAANPKWEEDHLGLAGVFAAGGDLPRASTEFEKVSQLDHRPDAAVFAAVCSRLAGDEPRADSLMRAVRPRMRGTDAEMDELVRRIREVVLERMGARSCASP